MTSRFAIFFGILLTSVCPCAIAGDEEDDEDAAVGFLNSGAGIPEATQEQIRQFREEANSTPTFKVFLDCKVTAAERGHTAGHFTRDDGTMQKLATEPQIAGLSFKVGLWTSGPRKGMADVFFHTQESKTALELGWDVVGWQRPAGHPTMLINVTALQTVGGEQQVLQQHTIMLATNLVPAPVYYTRTHMMRGDDAHLKKFMSVTTLGGTCTEAN